MIEKKYVSEFVSVGTERVADTTAFVSAGQLYECFIAYMATKYPDANRISTKLFLQLLNSRADMRDLYCTRGFLNSSIYEVLWGFKNLTLSPTAQKILEETK